MVATYKSSTIFHLRNNEEDILYNIYYNGRITAITNFVKKGAERTVISIEIIDMEIPNDFPEHAVKLPSKGSMLDFIYKNMNGFLCKEFNARIVDSHTTILLENLEY